MKAKKILFITQEIEPYVPNSEYTLLGRQMSQYVLEKGREIRSFMPKWGNINERRNQLHEVIRLSGMNLIIDDTDHPLIIKVASIPAARMQVYFIDNSDYFKGRQMRLDENGQEYADNVERSIFYARGVLETVKKLRWYPDVIHVHGWVGALIGLYVKVLYKEEPAFRDSRIVLSLYDNDDFQAPLCDDFLTRLRPKSMEDFDTEGINVPMNCNELFKLAIKYADGVIVNSPTVNEEALAFAREIGKPVLDYVGQEGYYDACNDFYELVRE